MEDCFLILEQSILHQFVFIARIWNHIRILIQRVKCLGLPTLYHHLVHFTRIGLSLQRELQHAFLQAIFHHGIDDPLCNWIPQGM